VPFDPCSIRVVRYHRQSLKKNLTGAEDISLNGDSRLLTLSLGGVSFSVGDGVSDHSVYGKALNSKNRSAISDERTPDRCSSRTFRQRAS
jgi:hypothetical protein